jgi:beta-1,4-N-acetylglucosaminyltransferase
MLTLLTSLDLSLYGPFNFVVASTDKMSQTKALHSTFFKKVIESGTTANFHAVPRAREVRQSWLSSVFSTSYASISSLLLFIKIRPALVSSPPPSPHASANRIAN